MVPDRTIRNRTVRTCAAALIAATAVLATGNAQADDLPIVITWDDLLPEDAEIDRILEGLGIMQHDDVQAMQTLEAYGNQVVTQYNGEVVRLPGFVVPFDFAGVGVTEFILVPYIGACIHVPPPPPNQLVYVTTKKPYQVDDLFEAVYVTGILTASSIDTEIASAGYLIEAQDIEPYDW